MKKWPHKNFLTHLRETQQLFAFLPFCFFAFCFFAFLLFFLLSFFVFLFFCCCCFFGGEFQKQRSCAARKKNPSSRVCVALPNLISYTMYTIYCKLQ
jgi:hypothetical protein